MYLYGKKIILRAIEEEDLEMLRELTNDPNFEKVIVGWSFPESKKDQYEWFMNCRNDSSHLRFIIATPPYTYQTHKIQQLENHSV